MRFGDSFHFDIPEILFKNLMNDDFVKCQQIPVRFTTKIFNNFRISEFSLHKNHATFQTAAAIQLIIVASQKPVMAFLS